jgi:hypothetical protein
LWRDAVPVFSRLNRLCEPAGQGSRAGQPIGAARQQAAAGHDGNCRISRAVSRNPKDKQWAMRDSKECGFPVGKAGVSESSGLSFGALPKNARISQSLISDPDLVEHRLAAAEVLASLRPVTIAKALAALPVEQQRLVISIADTLANSPGELTDS